MHAPHAARVLRKRREAPIVRPLPPQKRRPTPSRNFQIPTGRDGSRFSEKFRPFPRERDGWGLDRAPGGVVGCRSRPQPWGPEEK